MCALLCILAAQLCRQLSASQRLQFFGGLSVWMRLGDGCLDNVGDGEDLMRSLEYILVQLRGQQPSGDDDYQTIRRKLLAFQSKAHSRNAAQIEDPAASAGSGAGALPALPDAVSFPSIGAIVDGGAPSLPGGNLLVDEARKICGCMSLRSDLKVGSCCYYCLLVLLLQSLLSLPLLLLPRKSWENSRAWHTVKVSPSFLLVAALVLFELCLHLLVELPRVVGF